MGNCCCRKRKQLTDTELVGISHASMDAAIFGESTIEKKGLFDEESASPVIVKSKS